MNSKSPRSPPRLYHCLPITTDYKCLFDSSRSLCRINVRLVASIALHNVAGSFLLGKVKGRGLSPRFVAASDQKACDFLAIHPLGSFSAPPSLQSPFDCLCRAFFSLRQSATSRHGFPWSARDARKDKSFVLRRHPLRRREQRLEFVRAIS